MEKRIKYVPDGPVLDAFVYDDSPLAGISGPIGSGKSVGCAWRLMRHAGERTPATSGDHKGKRRSRFAVIRNTYPELKTTTIKTWHEWFPPTIGKWRDSGPPSHFIRTGDFEVEVLFIALESEADLGKLLSLELTGAWINEARELPWSVVEAVRGRCGRFPKRAEGSQGWSGVVMDTNKPDTEHWWYAIAEQDASSDFGRQIIRSLEEGERELRALGLLAPDAPLFRFFAQPGGRSGKAENLSNLEEGYYAKRAAGAREDWIKVYIDAEYGFVQEGRPVYPEYRDSVHCRPCSPIRGVKLVLGFDYGLTPAMVVLQRAPSGQVRVLDELVSQDMGAKRFGEAALRKLNADYPGYPIEAWGDPAGDIRAQTDENTPARIIRAVTNEAIDPRPAHTNDPVIRQEAVASLLNRMIDGEPALVIDPKCRVLRKGMGGAYHFRKRPGQGVGGAAYLPEPVKNFHSHVCEAKQYAILGIGEGRAVTRPEDTERRPLQIQAVDDINPAGVFAAPRRRINPRNFPDAMED